MAKDATPGPPTLPCSSRRAVPLRMTDKNGIVEHWRLSGTRTRCFCSIVQRGVHLAGSQGGEVKSYFTGEGKIIIAKQRSGRAGTYIKVRFDGPRGRWEGR